MKRPRIVKVLDDRPQRQVKVLDMPFTVILTDSQLSDEEIKNRWRAKHKYSKPLSEMQVDRERASVRQGKYTQIKGYKR